MKKIIPFNALLLVMLSCGSVVNAQNKASKPNIIKFSDLKKDNCTVTGTTFIIDSGNNDFTASINFGTAKIAKAKSSQYKILIKDGLPIDGKLNSKADSIYDYLFKKPFKGKDSTFVFNIVYIKNNKTASNCQYQFKVEIKAKKATINKPKAEPVDYITIAKELKLSVDLANLYLTANCCCNDVYPCLKIDGSLADNLNGAAPKKLEQSPKETDADYAVRVRVAEENANAVKAMLPKNRIIYDAKNNETYWFDNKRNYSVLSEQPRKYFSIPAGSPLAFEIIQVNPSAYKLSIKDTSESYYQDANDMLAKFLAPFSTTSNINAAGAHKGSDTSTKKDPKTVRINIVRAGLITVDAAIKDFLLNQANSCDYLHFKLLTNKIEAKRRIDSFLAANPIKKPATASLDQFMRNELEISKDDSTLYKVTNELYNTLITSVYHMEHLIPSVPYNKDKVVFKFSILAREKTPYVDKVNNGEIAVYVVNNFKVDVSTGLYYSWMKTDKYTLRTDSMYRTTGTKTDTIRGKRIVNENRNSGEFGFSSFLHFYKKNSPSFSWGGHIGVGVSLDNQVKPRYFGGLSFLIGRESGRIAANFGFAMGNVDVISNQYPTNSDGTFLQLPPSDTNIQYVSKFVIKPAVSISYNIPFSLKARTQSVPTDGTTK